VFVTVRYKFEIFIFVSRFLYSPRSLRLRQVHSCRIFPDAVSDSKFITSDDLMTVNDEW